MASPAWVVSARPVVDRHRSARASPREPGTARRWTGPARSAWSTARIGPGATRQRAGSASSTSTPWLRSIADGHVDVGLRRHGLAVVEQVEARRRTGPRPGAAPRRTGSSRRRRPRPGRRARGPSPCTVNGSAGPRRSRTPSVAQRVEHLADRPGAHVGVAVERDRPRRPAPATGGTKRVTVPARPQSTVAAAREGAGRDRPVVAGRVDVDPEGGQRPCHQQRCRASAGHGVRRTDRPRARPVPARDWSGTCCRAERHRARTGPSAYGAGQGSVVGRLALVTGAAYRGARAQRSAQVCLGDPRLGVGLFGQLAWPRGVRRVRLAGRARRHPACPRCRPRPGAARPSSRRS